MTRHELREVTFKIIFGLPFYQEEVEKDYQEDALLDETEKMDEKERIYVRVKVKGIRENLTAIDAKIAELSNGWDIKRLGKAELAILRVAIYEILFDEDIPNKVAVNEAVELAKAYCDEKASGFINGILSGVL